MNRQETEFIFSVGTFRFAPDGGGARLIHVLAWTAAVVVTRRPVSGVAALHVSNGKLLALRPGPPGEKGKDEE